MWLLMFASAHLASEEQVAVSAFQDTRDLIATFVGLVVVFRPNFIVSCSSDCGRGYCSAPNTCTCDPNFSNINGNSSLTCSVPVCSPACQNNGTCTVYGSTTQCKCARFWTGTSCSQRTCDPFCSLRGVCDNGVFVFSHDLFLTLQMRVRFWMVRNQLYYLFGRLIPLPCSL